MSETQPQDRLVSLDVFRGITIAAMILVNNPGTWSAIYGPLEHAPWHGITPTDYIFPFFLFIVGVAIPIALRKRMQNGVTRDLYLKIVQSDFDDSILQCHDIRMWPFLGPFVSSN